MVRNVHVEHAATEIGDGPGTRTPDLAIKRSALRLTLCYWVIVTESPLLNWESVLSSDNDGCSVRFSNRLVAPKLAPCRSEHLSVFFLDRPECLSQAGHVIETKRRSCTYR